MEKEYLILSYIQQQEDATQRDIARNTGIGLGTVNFFLKKMIEKGLIKIERLNAKSLRYMLTPQGIREKTEKTYKYIKRSYEHINKVTGTINELLNMEDIKGPGIVYLYGPRNELYEIIMLALHKQEGVDYKYVDDNELPSITGNVVLVWTLEDEEKLTPNHRVVNVLKRL